VVRAAAVSGGVAGDPAPARRPGLGP